MSLGNQMCGQII